MDVVLEAKLRELIAKQEITELMYERARALDRHDLDGQLMAFTADATVSHEGWQGTMRAFLMTRSRTAPGRNDNKVKIMDHFIANVLVFLDDESHARVHSYHLNTNTLPTDESAADRIIVGRYFDWVVRTAQGWKIQHRDVVFDWSISIPAGERTWASSVGSPHLLVGSIDGSDPFYSHFNSVEPPRAGMSIEGP